MSAEVRVEAAYSRAFLNDRAISKGKTLFRTVIAVMDDWDPISLRIHLCLLPISRRYCSNNDLSMRPRRNNQR